MHPEVLKDFSRIIVEFADADVKSKASPELAQRIWYDLCNNVAPKGMTIVGAEFSSAKNLVLSITPPASAVRFMESDIQNQLQLYLIHILEAPQNARIWVYPDQRWPRVIIHHVPIISTFLHEEDALAAAMWELTNYNPAIRETPLYILSKAQFLEPFNQSTLVQGTASLLIPLGSAESVQRLKAQGAFVYGKRHKVSVANPGNSDRRIA